MITAVTMTALISLYDPFQTEAKLALMDQCGPNRALTTVRPLLNSMAERGLDNIIAEEYYIYDEVVMDYWESRNGEYWWTPLCAARQDIGRSRLMVDTDELYWANN